MAATTILTLSGIGIPDYAARGLSQTLAPIGQGVQIVRDVNGTLRNLSNLAFQKYASSISGDDMAPPVIDRIWPGMSLSVGCIAELSYLTSGGSPARTVVSGSSRSDGAYTFYRPLLTMRIMNFSTATAEYDAAVSWQLDLEEI